MKKFIKWFLIILVVGAVIGALSDDEDVAENGYTVEAEISDSEETSKEDDEIHSEEEKDDTAKESESENDEEDVSDVIVEKVEKDESTDLESLDQDFTDIINHSQDIILDIRPNPHTGSYQQMEVVVDGNVWEVSTETDKIAFAESVHNVIAGSIYEHGALERSESVYLTIYDQNGYELAKQSIWTGKFDIKR